jgi:glycosyltransferase involved in cell wall biosynthesis
VFETCIQLPASDKLDAMKFSLRQFRPDLVYVHKVGDLKLLQALLQSGLPVIRMVHDHSLTCLRSYKYNYFTRKICRRRASLFCVFPCLATLQRNTTGTLPIKWGSYNAKQREMILTKTCDALVVYSQHQKDELVRNGFKPAQIEICVPIRSDGNRSQVSSFGPGNVLLYIGQIIRGKGVDVLLQALAKVQVPFRCNIVGGGNHQAYCERLCKRLGLSGRVRFCGYVPPAQLQKFYLEASAFLMSSLWPEPFGMSGPEAMRYGLPVVAFDAGGIGEWLKDGQNGFLVPWKDTEAFAARIEDLLKQKNLARRLGQCGQDWVKRYEPGRQIDRLEALFSRVIQAGNIAHRQGEAKGSPIGV